MTIYTLYFTLLFNLQYLMFWIKNVILKWCSFRQIPYSNLVGFFRAYFLNFQDTLYIPLCPHQYEKEKFPCFLVLCVIEAVMYFSLLICAECSNVLSILVWNHFKTRMDLVNVIALFWLYIIFCLMKGKDKDFIVNLTRLIFMVSI